MGYALLKKQAHSLFAKASFIDRIQNQSEYENALELMDELIEDYDYNKALISVLSLSIARWENEAHDFRKFNACIKSLDSGLAVLKVLMSQFNLGVSDFPEIGSKSLVSKIVNNKRRLTLEHIKKLSKRFNVSPFVFFDKKF